MDFLNSARENFPLYKIFLYLDKILTQLLEPPRLGRGAKVNPIINAGESKGRLFSLIEEELYEDLNSLVFPKESYLQENQQDVPSLRCEPLSSLFRAVPDDQSSPP